jgi:hypothetical protein
MGEQRAAQPHCKEDSIDAFEQPTVSDIPIGDHRGDAPGWRLIGSRLHSGCAVID